MTSKRDQMIAIRLTKAERDAINEAAAAAKVGPTVWIRQLAVSAADKAAGTILALAMCFAVGCGDADVGDPYTGTGGDAGGAGAGGELGTGGAGGEAGTGGSAGAGSVTCWADIDVDGFGAGAPLERSSCELSTSLVDNDLDCYNDNGIAYPGYDGPSQEFDRGDGSFDFDCDGLETPEHPISDCDSGISGWWFNDVAPPGCGELGNWRECGAESFLQKVIQACK